MNMIKPSAFRKIIALGISPIEAQSSREHNRFKCILLIYISVVFTFFGAQSKGVCENDKSSSGEVGRIYTRGKASLAISAPTGTTNNIADLAPMSWVVEAVRQAASERWNNFAVGQPIPCSNLAGQLICYQVPVVVGTNHFPDILTAPPAMEVSFADLHTPQLWAASEFWTFDVAAHRFHHPIPHFGPGLPPLLVTYHKAAELAQQSLASTQISLRHHYALTPTEQYYEFASPSGSNVTINARTLHISDAPLGVSRHSTQPSASSTNADVKLRIESLRREHEQKAQEAWSKIGNNIGSR